jgi:hypothetical protein
VDGEILVGRREESERFAALLAELAAGDGNRVGRTRLQRSAAESAAELPGSRVIIVHGLGGTGKSRLLRHFRDMSQGATADSPVPPGLIGDVWLDWDDDLGAYPGPGGPSLLGVLDAVQRAFAAGFPGDRRAAERASRAFDGYRQGAARMPEYVSRFADVLAQNRQSGSPFTSQDAMTIAKAAVSAGLFVGGYPGGFAGLAPPSAPGGAHSQHAARQHHRARQASRAQAALHHSTRPPANRRTPNRRQRAQR